MKALLLKAAVALTAAGMLASCSSSESSASSGLRLVPKSQVTGHGGSGWQLKRHSGRLPAEPSVALKQSAASLPKDKHGMPSYPMSQRVRYVRTTSYSCMENEPGAYGSLNASGSTLRYGSVRSAAADWSVYPVGTTFKIKGLSHTYVVDDYGSSLVGTNTIDIYHPSLRGMREWATRDVEIQVVRWGSWERTANLLKGRTRHSHCARMYANVKRKMASASMARTRGSSRAAL